MVDPLVVNRKLQKLTGYLIELEKMKEITLEEYRSDFRHRRTVERLIQLIVDVAVDINTHTIVDAGKPPPADAFNSFLEAAEIGLYPKIFAKEIAPSTGERNIIVHDYESIDDTIVFESISEAIELYYQYVKYVSEYNRKFMKSNPKKK
ncbi:hypothetical protein Psch_01280 [Pelotomaculum schinkii]|uniref:DUF86 domain-containing protein n=1 Tax=Pelotomaculum schinkii TaxID=78350 RepID=A0A4Y7RFE8_9FIRM|nr:DUF86 domain-containing protein [Pelotomaculum schinkii]TEB07725.1 hypothetical protein Psch_01280 [Pelotomaculum schinkii]